MFTKTTNVDSANDDTQWLVIEYRFLGILYYKKQIERVCVEKYGIKS